MANWFIKKIGNRSDIKDYVIQEYKKDLQEYKKKAICEKIKFIFDRWETKLKDIDEKELFSAFEIENDHKRKLKKNLIVTKICQSILFLEGVTSEDEVEKIEIKKLDKHELLNIINEIVLKCEEKFAKLEYSELKERLELEDEYSEDDLIQCVCAKIPLGDQVQNDIYFEKLSALCKNNPLKEELNEKEEQINNYKQLIDQLRSVLGLEAEINDADVVGKVKELKESGCTPSNLKGKSVHGSEKETPTETQTTGDDILSQETVEKLLKEANIDHLYNMTSSKLSLKDRLLQTFTLIKKPEGDKKTITIEDLNDFVHKGESRNVLNKYIINQLILKEVFPKDEPSNKSLDSYIYDLKNKLEEKGSTNTNDVTNNSKVDDCDIIKQIDEELNDKFKDQIDKSVSVVTNIEELINKIGGIIEKIKTDSKSELQKCGAEEIEKSKKNEEIGNEHQADKKDIEEEFVNIINVCLKEINGDPIESINEASIRTILYQYYKDQLDFLGGNREQIESNIKYLKELTLIHKCHLIKDLERGIEKKYLAKELCDRKDEVKKCCKDMSQEIDKSSSIKELIDLLIKKKEEENKQHKSQLNKIKEKIYQKSLSIIPIKEKVSEDKTPCELIEFYGDQIKFEVDEESRKINQLDRENKQLNEINANNDNKIKDLEAKQLNIKNQIKSRLAADIAKIEKVKGCSFIEEDEGSDEFENKLREKLEDALSNLKKSVEKDLDDVLQLYKYIQGEVEQELIRVDDKNDKAFNVVCKYYAYSRLAFMTDQSQEYGVKFDREAMAKIFGAVNTLLTDFGIVVNIPALFAETITDGDYEDVTGKFHSELDGLCSNVRNHKEKIDNVDHEDIIIDFDLVGYAKEGKMVRKTNVII